MHQLVWTVSLNGDAGGSLQEILDYFFSGTTYPKESLITRFLHKKSLQPRTRKRKIWQDSPIVSGKIMVS